MDECECYDCAVKRAEYQIIKKHSDIVFKWLNDNQLNNTMENIRRYYALKHGAIPNEKNIDEIYECISRY